MKSAKPTILIADDEKPTRDAMGRLLSSRYECLTAPDAEAALKIVKETPGLKLLITDYKMPPGDNGIELMKKARAVNPHLACILITAFGEIELAVKAMKEGADDFTTKPITDFGQLEERIEQAIRTNEAVTETTGSAIPANTELKSFTGSSPAMERVYRLIRKVAPASASVLIEGPSGSGKELTARAIHSLSPRANGPFVAVECAALSESLLESELFGHEAGSFTDAKQRRLGKFEAASGGTLFLDEIGEISLAIQVKLLRVLESRTLQRVGGNADIPVDFRLVAATNRDLAAMVREGTFREDLYYRLNVIDIRLPALCEHNEDVAPLVERFLKEFSDQNGGTVTGIEPSAMKKLEDYPWPGNVRQLRNVMEKMVVLASGATLTVDDLPAEIVEPEVELPIETKAEAAAQSLTLDEMKKQQMLAAIAACGGNKSKAAIQLGISRRTLQRKLNEWKIDE